MQEGVSAGVLDGQEILQADNFQFAQQEDGIIKISYIDENGQELVTYAAVKSES